MYLYNTLTKKIQEFIPQDKQNVKIYTCGPTVYSFAHIGNFAAYIYWDLLVRLIKIHGWTPHRVMNITDVGHLTSDGDEGDDKMEKGAKRENKTVWEIADFYTQARIEFNPETRNVSDFAIWKFIKDGEDHAMQWEFQGRPGYPGWHLECSTISHTELGETIDIHTGGIDHIPIHHTNEIAQSEAAFDLPMARFWLHCNFITSEGQKFSKSLGNAYTIHDLKERGFSPLDFKMWILQGHYQSERNFTLSDLESSRIRRLKWKNQIAELLQASNLDLNFNVPAVLTGFINDLQNKNSIPQTKNSQEIISFVDNNLNSAEAFSYIDQHQLTLDDWALVDNLFGIGLLAEQYFPDETIISLIHTRQKARQQKDFRTADQIREEIEHAGFTIKDQAGQPIWQYLK